MPFENSLNTALTAIFDKIEVTASRLRVRLQRLKKENVVELGKASSSKGSKRRFRELIRKARHTKQKPGKPISCIPKGVLINDRALWKEELFGIEYSQKTVLDKELTLGFRVTDSRYGKIFISIKYTSNFKQ